MKGYYIFADFRFSHIREVRVFEPKPPPQKIEFSMHKKNQRQHSANRIRTVVTSWWRGYCCIRHKCQLCFWCKKYMDHVYEHSNHIYWGTEIIDSLRWCHQNSLLNRWKLPLLPCSSRGSIWYLKIAATARRRQWWC